MSWNKIAPRGLPGSYSYQVLYSMSTICKSLITQDHSTDEANFESMSKCNNMVFLCIITLVINGLMRFKIFCFCPGYYIVCPSPFTGSDYILLVFSANFPYCDCNVRITKKSRKYTIFISVIYRCWGTWKVYILKT